MTATATVNLKGVAAKHKTAHIQAVTGPGLVIKGQIAPMAYRVTDLMPDFQVVVYGSPAPKGSLEYKGHHKGKPVLTSAAEGEKAWENAVRTMARIFVAQTPGWECINEPVFAAVSFSIPHTAASRKRGDIFHEDTPDADKLARATFDGLGITPIKVDGTLKMLPKLAQERAKEQLRVAARKKAILHDDKLVNGFLVTEKVYVGMTETALKQPGAVIQLWRKSRLN